MSDKYIKLEKIGEGTFGVVYRGMERKSGLVVALKKLRLETHCHDGIPCTTVREISILTQANNKNIVKLLDTIYSDKNLYLVFEYLETDLRKYLDNAGQHGLTIFNVKKFMWQLMSGVYYCHSHRILHRDLKPQNLLIDSEGNLKLADFGLARACSVPMRAYTREVVTLWYRSPELLLGCPQYSTGVDIWSVGCIFAEILSSRALFKGDSEIDQLYKIFSTLGTPNENIWPGVSQLPNFKVRFPNWLPKSLYLFVPNLDINGLNFLQNMLTYEPSQRISAKKALHHPYFDDYKQKYKIIVRVFCYRHV
ncbi:16142_t:CDS:2 [Entrophospora sp. SA101]|nr:16142_t:CDS:2 [Entrophospora sp. SA101]